MGSKTLFKLGLMALAWLPINVFSLEEANSSTESDQNLFGSNNDFNEADENGNLQSKSLSQQKVIVKGAENFNYVAGLRFDKFHVNDRLLYSVDQGNSSIVIFDAKTGRILERIITAFPVPDDLDIGPDTGTDPAGIERGTIYYTLPFVGGIGRIHPNGTQDHILTALSFTNGISFSQDGTRLFISQVFNPGTNGVFEILNFNNPNPAVPTTRTILSNIDSFGGGLNGFVTSNDGFIYGPLWYTGTVVKIDPNSGAVTTIPTKEVLYGGAHTGIDSKGRIYASDLMGKVIRINNLETGETQVLAELKETDTVFLDSHDRIYVSSGDLGSILELKNDKIRYVSKPGVAPYGAGGIAIIGENLYISESDILPVFDKKNGDLKKIFHEKDWLPDQSQFNFETYTTFLNVAPMPNKKLLSLTLFPSNQIAIFDVQKKNKISILSLISTGFIIPFAAIALDDFTIILSGVDEAHGDAAVVEKIVLNDDYSLNSITPITVTGLILPVGLTKSSDGSKVWVSDYAAGTITEIFSNTVVKSGLITPQGIALDKSGQNILFLEEITQSLNSINLSDPTLPPVLVASQLGSLNANSPGTPRFLPQGIISGVSVDPQTGLIYVASAGARLVWKIKGPH